MPDHSTINTTPIGLIGVVRWYSVKTNDQNKLLAAPFSFPASSLQPLIRCLRQMGHGFFDSFEGVLEVFELAVVVGFVGHHTCAALARERKCRCVEVAVAGKVEGDDLLLAGLLALEHFVPSSAKTSSPLSARQVRQE